LNGSALARINGKMLALQSRIARFAAAFIAVKAVAGVVTAGFDHFRQALDVGGALNDLSANSGVAVGDLVVLQQEFANAGKTAEDIGPVFGKMAKTLNSDSAADTVAKLGIKLEELKKKTPAEQFRTLGTAINSVRDPSQRAAISMELFGRSGAELLSPFFRLVPELRVWECRLRARAGGLWVQRSLSSSNFSPARARLTKAPHSGVGV
jgi:hypothetical protein